MENQNGGVVGDENDEASYYPSTVNVIVGLDHGQGSLRGFAKFLLAPPELRKKKDDLSYGCPIAKFCHVQCKKDSYRIIDKTVAMQLNDSIVYLKKSRLIMVTTKMKDKGLSCSCPCSCS